jgi:hypothetical protein
MEDVKQRRGGLGKSAPTRPTELDARRAAGACSIGWTFGHGWRYRLVAFNSEAVDRWSQ